MHKKLLKWIPFSLIALLLSTFAFFFVGCSKKNDSHSADSIPASNVYEDIAQYVQKNGQLDEYGTYIFYIIGDENSKKQILLGYDPEQNWIGIGAADFTIGTAFTFLFSKDTNYSKEPIGENLYRETHVMNIQFTIESNIYQNSISFPAMKYIDMNTITNLIDFAKIPNFDFDKASTLTQEEKIQALKQLSPIVSQGLTEFSNFYANTIKKNSKYIGATYKYFYLPVIK